VSGSHALVATFLTVPLLIRSFGVTADLWRLLTDALPFPMARVWLSAVGGLPPVDVPMSPLSNLGALPPSHPAKNGMMG
jgi:hypothetical protein